MKKYIILLFLLGFQVSYSQWERFGEGITSSYLFDFELVGDTIYTVTTRGIFSSTNNGLNWSPKNNGIEEKFSRNGYLDKIGSILFASIKNFDGYVYRSDDFGNSWIKLNSWPNFIMNNVYTSDSTIYIATTLLRGVFYSTDLGLSWNKLLTSFTLDTVDQLLIKDNYFLAKANNSFYLSKDFGQNWKYINVVTKYSYIYAFNAIGNNLIFSADSSIYLSTNNGDDWSQQKINRWGLNEFIYCFANVGSAIFAGGWYGVYMSLDTGRTWINVVSDTSSGEVQLVISLAVKDGYLFAGTSDVGGFRAKISDLIAMVGVEEDLQNVNNPIITPNPAEDFIEINLDGWAAANIKVFNALGECVYLTPALSQSEGVVRIDVSALPAGMYFAVLQSGGQSVTEQFAVVR